MLTSPFLTTYLPLLLTDMSGVFAECELHRGSKELCHYMTNLTSEDDLLYLSLMVENSLDPN